MNTDKLIELERKWRAEAAELSTQAGREFRRGNYESQLELAQAAQDASSRADELAAALRAEQAVGEEQRAWEAGMLPDALVPHAKEWYRLCERRFTADRMTISGQLAEAIVDAICALGTARQSEGGGAGAEGADGGDGVRNG